MVSGGAEPPPVGPVGFRSLFHVHRLAMAAPTTSLQALGSKDNITVVLVELQRWLK